MAHAFGATYGGGSLVRKGLSYAPNPGNPVRAVHAGRVVFADWLRGSGLLIVLDHGQGYMSLYGHNEALTVNGGDWVDAAKCWHGRASTAATARPGYILRSDATASHRIPLAWLVEPAVRTGGPSRARRHIANAGIN